MPDGETQCMIIQPHTDWTHWDSSAESLHGISRGVLLRHGRNLVEVASSLNESLRGEVVYSDAWGNDSSWLSLLFEYAEMPQKFQIESLRSLMSESQVASWEQVKQSVIREYGYRRHRASHDAVILQRAFILSSQLV